MDSFIYETIYTIGEEYDKFIASYITPWCNNVMQTEMSKEEILKYLKLGIKIKSLMDLYNVQTIEELLSKIS